MQVSRNSSEKTYSNKTTYTAIPLKSCFLALLCDLGCGQQLVSYAASHPMQVHGKVMALAFPSTGQRLGFGPISAWHGLSG